MYNDPDFCPMCGSDKFIEIDDDWEIDDLELTQIRTNINQCEECGCKFKVVRYVGVDSLYVYGDNTPVYVIDGSQARREAMKMYEGEYSPLYTKPSKGKLSRWGGLASWKKKRR